MKNRPSNSYSPMLSPYQEQDFTMKFKLPESENFTSRFFFGLWRSCTGSSVTPSDQKLGDGVDLMWDAGAGRGRRAARGALHD